MKAFTHNTAYKLYFILKEHLKREGCIGWNWLVKLRMKKIKQEGQRKYKTLMTYPSLHLG